MSICTGIFVNTLGYRFRILLVENNQHTTQLKKPVIIKPISQIRLCVSLNNCTNYVSLWQLFRIWLQHASTGHHPIYLTPCNTESMHEDHNWRWPPTHTQQAFHGSGASDLCTPSTGRSWHTRCSSTCFREERAAESRLRKRRTTCLLWVCSRAGGLQGSGQAPDAVFKICGAPHSWQVSTNLSSAHKVSQLWVRRCKTRHTTAPSFLMQNCEYVN